MVVVGVPMQVELNGVLHVSLVVVLVLCLSFDLRFAWAHFHSQVLGRITCSCLVAWAGWARGCASGLDGLVGDGLAGVGLKQMLGCWMG